MTVTDHLGDAAIVREVVAHADHQFGSNGQGQALEHGPTTAPSIGSIPASRDHRRTQSLRTIDNARMGRDGMEAVSVGPGDRGLDVVTEMLDPVLVPLGFAPGQVGVGGSRGQAIFCRGEKLA